ncbi:BC85_0335 family putative methyltransferase [Mycoplasma leonicaptivi]|uniref:BC85_0335 family putative methyltransferase n=1 Tax=Mycoplasma leonicaptivi TaxID=36742 RepID=UPI00056A4754|nr:hypothetical protein [Mycoplasma leonicaptivi]
MTKTQIGLMISAIIIFVLGISIYIGILIYVKKYTKKYIAKSQAEALEQIRSIRNELGLLPFQLQEDFPSKTEGIDIEGVINTIILNNYAKNLIIAKNDEFSFACVNQKINLPLFYDIDEFEFDKYTKIRYKKAKEFPNEIKPYDFGDLDFVGVFSSNKKMFDLFDQFYEKLNDKGMLLISLKNFKRKEINNLLNDLKIKKISYEISYFSTRFLFIVKKIENNVK